MAETETLTIFLEERPRRDVGRSRDRDVETETTTLVIGDIRSRSSRNAVTNWQSRRIFSARVVRPRSC